MPAAEEDIDEKAERLRRARNFQGCVVRAYLRGNSIKTNSHGDWEFSFVIPRERTADVLAMSEAVGIPVIVGVRPWRRGDSPVVEDTPMDEWATEEGEDG